MEHAANEHKCHFFTRKKLPRKIVRAVDLELRNLQKKNLNQAKLKIGPDISLTLAIVFCIKKFFLFRESYISFFQIHFSITNIVTGQIFLVSIFFFENWKVANWKSNSKMVMHLRKLYKIRGIGASRKFTAP